MQLHGEAPASPGKSASRSFDRKIYEAIFMAIARFPYLSPFMRYSQPRCAWLWLWPLNGPRSNVNNPIESRYLTFYTIAIVISALFVTINEIFALELCVTFDVDFGSGQSQMHICQSKARTWLSIWWHKCSICQHLRAIRKSINMPKAWSCKWSSRSMRRKTVLMPFDCKCSILYGWFA